MQVRVALVLLLAATAAQAQGTRDPYGPVDDEPTPHDPPPVIYVPIPPPIIAPPPYAPEGAPPAANKKGGFIFRLDLGADYRYALKDSFGAANLRMLLGGETGHVGFGGFFDLEMGGSKEGLFYSVLDVGFLFYGIIGEHVRLGLGPQFGFMTIQRATNDNPFEDLIGFLVGVNADLSVDLVTSRRSALLLFGRLRYDFVDTGAVSPFSHGATFVVGIGARL
jgi:hypothetical protein